MTDFRPGDLVEIATVNGLAYAQITHNHASYPPVVRAIVGLHDKRPSDVASLAQKKTAFVAMIPLAGAMKHVGAPCEVVGHVEIPEQQRAFPTFRMPIRDKKGEVVYWWFWDGRGLRYATDLDAAQKKLPLREVMKGRRFLDLVSSGEPGQT